MEKDLLEFEGFYKVNSDGQIWSIVSNRFLTPHKNKKGYHIIHLSKSGFHKNFILHRLIAKSFIPNPENKPQINHKNGIKTDNRIDNLEWCTGSENIIHAFKNGLTSRKGERSAQAVLTNEDVLNIREIFKNGNPTLSSVAEIYKTCTTTIWNIKNKKRWTHI